MEEVQEVQPVVQLMMAVLTSLRMMALSGLTAPAYCTVANLAARTRGTLCTGALSRAHCPLRFSSMCLSGAQALVAFRLM